MRQTVAVVGLGRMGAAMARRIAGSGVPVILWNRTHSTATALAEELGAAVASTPAEAARRADVVVASLADDAAVKAVQLGTDGIVAGVRAGAVVVETSTIDPSTVAEVHARLSQVDAHYLDAPVSGSVALVDQGSVTTMAGGPDAAIEQARPVIGTYSKAIFHMGASGTGATMKLAVNALVHATNLALSESLVLAELAGIDRTKAYEVIASGAAASPFVLYKREAFERPEHTPVAFSLDLVAKDLRLILALAARLGAPMRQGETTANITHAAIEDGLGDDDMSAVAIHLRRLAEARSA